MFRHVGVVGAAVLLCAAVGCSIDSFLVSVTGQDGKRQVVSGSVDDVALSLQASLSRLQIFVVMDHLGQDVRLTGTTRSGKKFALILKDQTSGSSRRTAVTVEWEGAADETFWGMVVESLTTSPPKRDPFAP